MEFEPISLSGAVRRAAEQYPETAFLSDSRWVAAHDDVRDYRGLDAFVDDFADRLWAAGLRPGRRVAIVKRDHVDIQAIAAAAMRIGAVPALLSWRMRPDELVDCVRRLDEPVVVLDDAAAERFVDVRDELARLASDLLAIGDAPPEWTRPASERAAHEPYEHDPDELAIVHHTSGTTGVPKLAGGSVRTLFAHAAPAIEIGRQLNDRRVSLKCLSWGHSRTSSGLIALLELGVPLVALTDPRVEHVKAVMLEHRPASVEAHPNMLLRWEPLAGDPERPLASVARYLTTFDAMHPRTVRSLLNASDEPVALHIQGYGQTETGPTAIRFVTRETADEVAGRSVGTPIAGMTEIRVVDERDEPVPPGQPGRIQARTPGLMLGYLGTDVRPERGSWWTMGDVGRVLEDGTVELLDRVVDSSQRFESLLELEDELLDSLPELDEVVLVKPAPDEVAAVVCVRDGRPLDREGWAAVAERLGIGDVAVHQWSWEELPFTGSWKVRRHLLAEMVRERAGEAVAR